jgi:hypothetical protein
MPNLVNVLGTQRIVDEGGGMDAGFRGYGWRCIGISWAFPDAKAR